MNSIKYLRVIVNNTCNLSCFFCHKEGEHCEKKYVPFDSDEMIAMLQIMKEVGIRKIKFLGGEPTLCKELPKVVSAIRGSEIDLSLITNGVVDRQVLEKLCQAGIDRINVSLHGFDGDIFQKVTGGSKKQLQQTFTTIEYLKSENKLGKINYVLLKSVNENEFFKVVQYVVKNGLILDVLNYIGSKEEEIKKFYYPFDEIKLLIQSRCEIASSTEYINKWSLPSTRLKLIPQGEINLKTTKLNSVDYLNGCTVCDKRDVCIEGISAIRLTAQGIIKPCIFRDDNIFDLKGYMSNHSKHETIVAVEKYLEAI